MKIKIVVFSDTHGKHNELKDIPDGDILIFAGDLCHDGSVYDYTSFNKWLGYLPHTFKIIIAGNHDRLFQTSHYEAKSYITNATYIQEETVEIMGLKIYGSPWTPFFNNWAFNAHRGAAISEKWVKIPEDTDILVTHGPAKGMLDLLEEVVNGVEYRLELGCEALAARIKELKNLKLHCVGHIHHSGGQTKVVNGVTFINAAVVNEAYKVVNKPQVFEIEV